MISSALIQVSTKEVTRQLQRERDKNKNLTQKYHDARSEADQLQMALLDKPSILDNTPYKAKMANIHSTLGAKKVIKSEEVCVCVIMIDYMTILTPLII